jgi:transcriptional regulator with GAF, ATPase, and Fis domain
MIELIKDRINLGLIMAVLFFVGIIASIYSIYSIPHSLMLQDGYQSVFTNVYLIVGLTFLVGTLSLWYNSRHKNEVVVYRDKQLEKATSDNTANDQSGLTTISLESVKISLKQAKGQKETLQAGLHTICKQLEAGQGAIYVTIEKDNVRRVELKAGYALSVGESTVISFEFGEGLVGQAASGGRTLYIDEVPDGYVKIISGLGSSSPKYILIVPLKQENNVFGVMEIASFTPITEDQRKFVEESAQLIAGSLTGNE